MNLMPRNPKRLAVFFAAASLTLVACGSESPEEKVEGVVSGYYAAIADDDLGGACEAVDSSFMDSFADSEFASVAPNLPPNLDQGECERFLEDDGLGQGPDDFTVTDVRVQDDSAIVQVGETKDTESQVELDEVDGEWKITSEPILNGAILYSVIAP
jgi:hypothetical protein